MGGDDSGCVPVADGFVHELRGNGAVYTAADSTDDTTLGPTDLPDPGDLLPNEFLLHHRVSLSCSLGR